MKLGIINSAFQQVGIDTATGLGHVARIGFDCVDVFTEAVGISKKEIALVARASEKLNLPIVSLPVVSVGLVDFNEPVREFHIERTKKFYAAAFGWTFEDYGPDYTSFQDGRLSGGFTKDAPVRPANPLVVVYAARLEDVEAKVKQAGGKIVRQTYTFPGGRRFHFSDPSGNELAVWTDR